ncbi:NUDIX hydrolase family protein [Leucobacter chromiiresistens]|uniref:ADP-ribose pyrophosphatase YjhB, NUDIX family n=1 Tax=Leucobacter chromiiresistens TaxID=1079994 RepID=A0A1H1BF16_9MICO|nr:NUDIX hydrolase family protein [Leucobacter chromiiresistens]SDQ50502.1 ADP-ribose pyrophosphatase YjhB, NUDIX family [Leucobacter chromiiresistens]
MTIDTAELPDPEGPEDRPTPPGNPGWLSDDELSFVRGRMPIMYVEAVPVRLDGLGQVVEVGLLLRSTPEGVMQRSLVSGRVRYGETLREALFRHLENDLGPMAFPQMPAALVPAQVAEYFPMPGISPFVDDRQHAVSLVYVVPVTGTCNPRQDALEVTWMAPDEAMSPATLDEFSNGRGALLRQALASISC